MQGNMDEEWKNLPNPNQSMQRMPYIQKKKNIPRTKNVIFKPHDPDNLRVDTTPSIVNYLLQRNYKQDNYDSYKNLIIKQDLTKALLPTFVPKLSSHDIVCSEGLAHIKYTDKIPYCLNWAPNSKKLLVGNSKGEIAWIDALTFRPENNADVANQSQGVRSIALSKDEKFYATGDTEGTLKLFNIHMKLLKEITTCEQKYPIREISVAPTNLKFVTAIEDKTLKIWDVEKGKLDKLLEGHRNEVLCCDWHLSKGLIVSGSKDNTIKFWDPSSSNSEISTLYNIPLKIISWHPFNEKIFVSGDKQGAIGFWVALEKDPIFQITQAHAAQKKDRDNELGKLSHVGSKINDLLWSPLGNMLASCGQDKCIKFWGRMKLEDMKIETAPNNLVNLSSVDNVRENIHTGGQTFPLKATYQGHKAHAYHPLN